MENLGLCMAAEDSCHSMAVFDNRLKSDFPCSACCRTCEAAKQNDCEMICESATYLLTPGKPLKQLYYGYLEGEDQKVWGTYFNSNHRKDPKTGYVEKFSLRLGRLACFATPEMKEHRNESICMLPPNYEENLTLHYIKPLFELKMVRPGK